MGQYHEFWVEACRAAVGQTIPELQRSNFVANGVAVRTASHDSARAMPPDFELRWYCTELLVSSPAQCGLCSGGCCCGVAVGGTSSEIKYGNTWANTGDCSFFERGRRFRIRFFNSRRSGAIFLGCIFGVAAFAAYLQTRQLFFESELRKSNPRENYELLESSLDAAAVFYAVYPLELLCTIFAMNMLLRRVSDHASHR
jgi:hypothetical protein